MKITTNVFNSAPMDSPDSKEVESLLREPDSENCAHCVKKKSSTAQVYHLAVLYIIIFVLLGLLVSFPPEQEQHLYCTRHQIIF